MYLCYKYKRGRPPPFHVHKFEVKDVAYKNGIHVVTGAQECDNKSMMNYENRENGEIRACDGNMVNGEIRVRKENKLCKR